MDYQKIQKYNIQHCILNFLNDDHRINNMSISKTSEENISSCCIKSINLEGIQTVAKLFSVLC